MAGDRLDPKWLDVNALTVEQTEELYAAADCHELIATLANLAGARAVPAPREAAPLPSMADFKRMLLAAPRDWSTLTLNELALWLALRVQAGDSGAPHPSTWADNDTDAEVAP